MSPWWTSTAVSWKRYSVELRGNILWSKDGSRKTSVSLSCLFNWTEILWLWSQVVSQSSWNVATRALYATACSLTDRCLASHALKIAEYLDMHALFVFLRPDMKFTWSHTWGRAVGSRQESGEIQTNRSHWKKVCCCCYDALLLGNTIQQIYVEKKKNWRRCMILRRWKIKHTGAVSCRLFRGIIWIFCPDWSRCTFDPLTSQCGSIVFVSVHRQILCELHVLLSFDGGSFIGPRQSL